MPHDHESQKSRTAGIGADGSSGARSGCSNRSLTPAPARPTVRRFDASAIAPPRAVARPSFALDPETPLDLEIGCGVGWHPIAYALAHPTRNLIAIEHTREKFLSFERRWLAHGSPRNVHPVHADAVRWVTHLLPPASVDRIFLLYPNPEAKAANRRWLRMPFFERLLEVLKPGGTIQLATNLGGYMTEATTYATEVWKLQVLETRAFQKVDAPAGLPRTHFEKKYLDRGETCFDVTFLKT